MAKDWPIGQDMSAVLLLESRSFWYYFSHFSLSCIPLMRRGEIISPLLYTQRISRHQKMPENELVIEGNLEVILEGIQVAHCNNTFDIPLVPDMCRSDLTNAVVSCSGDMH